MPTSTSSIPRRPCAHLDAYPLPPQASRVDQILWHTWMRGLSLEIERWAKKYKPKAELPVGASVLAPDGLGGHLPGIIIQDLPRTARYMIFFGTREELAARMAREVRMIVGAQVPYEDVQPL